MKKAARQDKTEARIDRSRLRTSTAAYKQSADNCMTQDSQLEPSSLSLVGGYMVWLYIVDAGWRLWIETLLRDGVR